MRKVHSTTANVRSPCQACCFARCYSSRSRARVYGSARGRPELLTRRSPSVGGERIERRVDCCQIDALIGREGAEFSVFVALVDVVDAQKRPPRPKELVELRQYVCTRRTRAHTHTRDRATTSNMSIRYSSQGSVPEDGAPVRVRI